MPATLRSGSDVPRAFYARLHRRCRAPRACCRALPPPCLRAACRWRAFARWRCRRRTLAWRRVARAAWLARGAYRAHCCLRAHAALLPRATTLRILCASLPAAPRRARAAAHARAPRTARARRLRAAWDLVSCYYSPLGQDHLLHLSSLGLGSWGWSWLWTDLRGMACHGHAPVLGLAFHV